MRRSITSMLPLVLALILCSACSTPKTQMTPAAAVATDDMGPPSVGDLAPDFELPAREGGSVKLSSFRGSIVVLHFTASWCAYCEVEVAGITRIAKQYGKHGVKVLLVDVQEKEKGWSWLKRKVSHNVLLLRDVSGDIAASYAPPKAVPSFTNRAEVMLAGTLIVGRDGHIQYFELVDSNVEHEGLDVEFRNTRVILDRLVGKAK